ncbi:MAG: CzcE family metal-binding protein [Pseudomonadota bacterium]|nr:CzcE family metal-binding protein [Pseudomonadota bacterium]
MTTPFIHVLVAAMLAAFLSGCADSMTRLSQPRMDLLGMPVLEQPLTMSSTRVVVIDADTRWVNVDGGDTVRFIVGDRSFAWNFQVNPSIAMFYLQQIAPPGALTHRVAVYVAPNPLYGSGG